MFTNPAWWALLVSIAAFIVSWLNARRTAQRDRANIRFNIEGESGRWQLINHGPSDAFALGISWIGPTTIGPLVKAERFAAGADKWGSVTLKESGTIFIEWRDASGKRHRRFLEVKLGTKKSFGNAYPLVVSSVKSGRTATQIRYVVFRDALLRGNPWRKLR